MINETLKLIRNYSNIKQKDLAERLGISASYLSEIEKGSKPVSYELLENYAKIVKMPVSTITFLAESRSMPSGNIAKKLQAKIADSAVGFLTWMDNVSKINESSSKTEK